jgi:pimeloyl-ACP methyl ester carboxylesterase
VPIAETHGRQIFFEDKGSGAPVVLGHSFLCTGEMWREQVRRLAGEYRLINPDLRGHGRSGPADRPFSLYDAVEDVIAVLDLLRIERAVWCGLSIGGMVAIRAALSHPDRVAALILLDSDAGSETLMRKLKYRAMGLGTRLSGVRPFLPAISRLMFGPTTRRENPGLVREWRNVFAAVDLPSILMCLDALLGRDSVLERLPEIDVPALVVVGEEDRSLPPTLSRRINDGLPDSTLTVVRGAGHLSALEQPSQVNAAIESFLQARVSPVSA